MSNGKSRPSPDATPVSDLKLDDYLPYRLSMAANAVSELISRAYQARFGLTIPQWRLIAVLGEDGSLAQQELCARTLMDKVTVSRSSAALADRGLISRTAHASDGRSHRLSLTSQGKALYLEIAPAALAYESKLLARFTAFEQQTALNLLRRLEVAAIDLAEFDD